ncbi:hypothetical protein [Cytobacillus firmus]|uniref:hypothetical protein n=1 Tax=Cytobacillus firmus TaxID=1399 RepID=UPI003001B203
MVNRFTNETNSNITLVLTEIEEIVSRRVLGGLKKHSNEIKAKANRHLCIKSDANREITMNGDQEGINNGKITVNLE